MRPLLVRAVSIDGILENMGRMQSLAAEAHRKITRRYHGTLLDPREWRGLRRQAGAGP